MEIIFTISIVLIIFILNILFAFVFRSIFILPRAQLTYWSVNIVLAVFLIRDYPWSYFSFLYIIATCIAFLCGYLLIKEKNVVAVFEEKKLKKGLYKKILIFSIIAGTIYPVLQIYNYGFSVSNFFSLTSLLEMNNSIAIARYSDNSPYSLMNQLFLVFVYLSALLGGYGYVIFENTRDRYVGYFAVIPSIITVLVLNTKATILGSIILWCSSMIVAYKIKNGTYKQVNYKNIFRYLSVFVVLLAFLLFLMMLRIGRLDLNTYYIVIDKFMHYLIGHMAAFDYWFFREAVENDLHFGAITFLSLSNILGVETRIGGLYTEFFHYNNINTNVYTAFRAIILDFGIIGSIIVYFVLGIILHQCICYMKSKNKALMILGAVSVIAFYSYLAWGFVASIFTYLSYIASYILLYFILVISYKSC